MRSSERTNSSGVPLSRPILSLMPALFTSASIRPNRSIVLSTALRQLAGDVRSAAIEIAHRAEAAQLFHDFFAAGRVAIHNHGNRAFRAHAREIAAPMPLPPPVTITTLSLSCRSIGWVCLSRDQPCSFKKPPSIG